MADAQSNSPDEPPYPTYKERTSNGERVSFSPGANRLFWPLQGTFPDSISVLKFAPKEADTSLRDPFFQPNTNGTGNGTWHDIASLPITEPKVSSIEVSLPTLDQWERDWLEWHEVHETAEYCTYGDLSDEHRPHAKEPREMEDGSWEWEEDSDTDFLIRCCGEERPLGKKGNKLEVTASAGNSFVTVHDYVSAVHPWLMTLRGDILQAKSVEPYTGWGQWAVNLEWLVINSWDAEIKIEEKNSWLDAQLPSQRPWTLAFVRFCQRRGVQVP